MKNVGSRALRSLASGALDCMSRNESVRVAITLSSKTSPSGRYNVSSFPQGNTFKSVNNNFVHVTACAVPSPPETIVAFARHTPQNLDSADLL